jgi:hypothetical protein
MLFHPAVQIIRSDGNTPFRTIGAILGVTAKDVHILPLCMPIAATTRRHNITRCDLPRFPQKHSSLLRFPFSEHGCVVPALLATPDPARNWIFQGEVIVHGDGRVVTDREIVRVEQFYPGYKGPVRCFSR